MTAAPMSGIRTSSQVSPAGAVCAQDPCRGKRGWTQKFRPGYLRWVSFLLLGVTPLALQEKEATVPKRSNRRTRSWVARVAVLAAVFSLLAVALPASAHLVAIDTSTPCPASTPSAGFTDIGGFDSTTQTAINCLFAFGITKGTSPTTYSPNDTTARWQMALFLIRQAAVHGISIPAPVAQGYTDIGALPQATQDAINQITQLGISKGTTTTTFSPLEGVSRWQMALFIYRLGLAAGVALPDDPAHNQFTDIGNLSTEAQTAINALADKHIALGTGGTAFSPDLLLTRWEMALFLTRLLAADAVPAPGPAPLITATVATNGGTSLVLDVGDTITVDFDTDVAAPLAGTSIDLVEALGGTSVRLTCGTNVTCVAVDANTLGFTVTAAPTLLVAGDNSVINGVGIIDALLGILGINGLTVDVDSSLLTARTFVLS